MTERSRPDDSIIGNLYSVKGKSRARAWWVIAVEGQGAILLGLDNDLNIVSAARYAIYAFDHREPIGYLPVDGAMLVS